MTTRSHNVHTCLCRIFGLLLALIFLQAERAPGAQVIQTLPFYDSFDYNQGSLSSSSSTVWETAASTANIAVAPGTNASLTLAGFVPSAGSSASGNAKAYRFAGTQFTTQNAVDGQTVFVSFLYQVTAYSVTNPSVIAFLDQTNFGTAQISFEPGTGALALLIDKTGHIGINAGSITATGAQFEASATPLNSTVLIVARYTFHTAPGKDVVDLWVNPVSSSYGGTAPTPDKTVTSAGNCPSLADFTLSCNGNDSFFGQKWDEVRIATTWAQAAPASNPPGAASAAHSLMIGTSTNTMIADGVSTSIVKMQARDIHGINLISGGATVVFTNSIGTMGATTDNGDGTYQATLTAPVTVGTALVSAKLGGTAIASSGTATNVSSVAIACTLGPVSATVSTAVANPTTAAADGATASTITVTAKDAQGRPLSGQTISLNVSGSGNTVSTPAPTGANGQTTATLTSTVAETKTITVTIGSTQINAQPTVTFTAQGVSGFNSTAVASPNTGLVADGVSTSTITVTAKDGNNLPLSGKTVVLSVSGSGNIFAQPAPTDVNGQATATLQSTVAETKTITVTVDGTTINAQPTVAFVPGPATQIAFTSQPVTTPVSVTLPAVAVQIEDQTGNPVPQSGATVTLALSAGTLSGTNPQVTDANGKATFNDLSIQPISSGLYLTASCAGFNPVQSSVFNVPPKIFYKANNASALSLAASWATSSGGAGPAGPPASDSLGIWDANSGSSTVDIGGNASWYGMLLTNSSAVTITDTTGGHALTLGAGGFDGSTMSHSVTMNNGFALSADETWKWNTSSFILTLGGNVNNGGHVLTITANGNPAGGEKLNGAITGAGGLTLTGGAVVTLSGTNTYTGNTTISGGKLVINTNGSIAGSSGILLSSNTTLDVSAASPFTMPGGQTLTGITTGGGTATIAANTANGLGALILAPGAQANFTAIVNAASNTVSIGALKVLGGVTLNGNAITVNVTGAPLSGGTYTLMTATNGFTINSPPTLAITGQGLSGNVLPQIVVNGQNLQLVVGFGISPAALTNVCGSSATFTVTPALGATGYQWYDNNGNPIPGATNTTLFLPATHPSDSGAYQIVATLPTGTFTNSATLLTADSAPPIMALNGNSTVAVPLGGTYTEPGATGLDACSGSSLPVTTIGTVNTSVTGEYALTYTAVTGEGVSNSITRAVVVFDPGVTTPAASMNLDFGAATDANPLNPITVPTGWTLLAFGDLYQNPQISGSPSFPNPDGNNPGLTLSFGSISGWSTASTENNGANTNSTVGISANGFINYGSKGSGLPATFTLSGMPFGKCVSIYAVNGWDGLGSSPVITFGGQTTTVNAGSLDASPTIGEFQYVGTAIATNGTVSGSWTGIGGTAIEGQIGGMIIRVQSIPLDNLVVSPAPAAVQCGANVTFTAFVDGLPPISYQWYDNNNNPIPGATNASYTLPDTSDANVGNYTVVAQGAYNSLTNSTAITGILHTAPPVMTLNGANPVNLIVSQPYLEGGATAFDQCAQASLPVTTVGTVDTSLPGTYTITYSAITADGTPGSITRTVNVSVLPNFGSGTFIFDPTMTNIQSQLDAIFAVSKYNQFGPQRYALMFKPGYYPNLDINVGYYTELLGLGQMPDGVTLPGFLHSDGVLVSENATVNFWRSAENLCLIPTNSTAYTMWAVSQGTALRRMHIQNNLDLANHTDGNFASGGFMSDSKVDGTMSSISQQQWLCRNDMLGKWSGNVWNMVFVGVSNAPAALWPANHTTTITNTPLIAEKPYLYLDTNGNYAVLVPALQTNSFGVTWGNGPTPGTSIPITQFYIAQAGADNAFSINAALNAGLNLILTPGVYHLASSLQVTRPDTVILGLGYPTLIPQNGTPALTIADVDGVKVAGLLFDAGPVQSPTLLQVATNTSSVSHANDPTFLYDISMRVGGPEPGSTLSCMEINANDVVGDNLWLWRADHGSGVGWTLNTCNNGLIVNGDRVTMYGLFVEHHEQYQTLWNGNWGRCYFYQSEFPYDPPSQAAWSHDGVQGYASYKVADTVTSHQAYGLGIYAVFIDCVNISCFNAIETPTNAPQVNMHDMINVYIAGNVSDGGTSSLYHIINGTGATLSGPGFGGTATANYIWQQPTFNLTSAMTGSGASITLPTESDHTYQLQYKNSLSDPWSNLGSPVGGNDSLETLTDPAPPTIRFYRVGYQ